MGLSANRGEIDENRREKRVRSKIIAPPTRLTTSSESDRSPQLAENKGFSEYRVIAVRVCKTICRPT
jgi:hypothetical protein